MKTLIFLFLSFIPALAFADSDREKLIGHWQYLGDPGYSDLIFQKDGTFSIDISLNGKSVANSSGKWSVENGVIHYEYLKSTSVEAAPGGTREENQLDSLTDDYFVVTRRDGNVVAYTRVTDDSKATAGLTSDQLQALIPGVWFSEDLVFRDNDGPLHVGERIQYFPGGQFAADYRISYAGGAEYIRMTGDWSITDGKFIETAKESSNPEKIAPPLTRRIVTITGKKMIVVSDDGTHAAVMVRGDAKPATGKISVSSLDEKKLFKDLQSVHMSGFNPVPVPGSDKSSWVLDSHMAGTPPAP
jgi:hypothetical protein